MKPKDLRIWALLSYRAGMNSQILGAAELLEARLGIEVKRRRLRYRPGWAGWWPAYLGRVTLAGVEDSPESLGPPWPDLIVTAGRRHEPVCRWIRQQSGGHTKLVFLGRTWAPLRHFDLIVTTPQYRLPPRSNVLETLTTLHRVTPQRLQRAKEAWASTFEAYPRPRVVVLVGGNSGPYVLGPNATRRLLRGVETQAQGGSLLVTTSARTPSEAVEILRSELPPSAYLYRYGDEGENPYFGLLAHADSIVVTGDSIAMLSEAIATGKPVFLFDLGHDDQTWQSRRFRWRMRLGPRWLDQWMSRDLSIVHRRLVEAGLVSWLPSSP